MIDLGVVTKIMKIMKRKEMCVATLSAFLTEEACEEVLHLLHAPVLRQPLEDPVAHHARLAGPLPQHVGQQQAVELAHRGAPVGVRSRAVAVQVDPFEKANLETRFFTL
jgi:hypothetical protein